MAQTTNSDSALSGGLLVVLGVIVAVVLAYFVWANTIGSGTKTTNVTIEAPAIEAPSIPAPSVPATPNP